MLSSEHKSTTQTPAPGAARAEQPPARPQRRSPANPWRILPSRSSASRASVAASKNARKLGSVTASTWSLFPNRALGVTVRHRALHNSGGPP